MAVPSRALSLAAAGICLLGPATARGQQVSAPLLQRCHYPARPDSSWTLPGALKEISGLALVGNRLLAHDDERGRIFELSPASGRVISSWPLAGEPPDDYEGIATDGTVVHLLTSKGLLYTFPVPRGAGPLRFTVQDTRLGSACEFEGLAWDSFNRVLLLPCKEIRGHARGVAIRIYRWAPAQSAPARPAVIEVSNAALRRATPWHDFAPSAVELDSRTGNLLLLSGRQRGIMELSRTGAVLAVRALNSHDHRQAEGLTITAAGDLLISDEGAGARARLSLYRCRP